MASYFFITAVLMVVVGMLVSMFSISDAFETDSPWQKRTVRIGELVLICGMVVFVCSWFVPH